MKTVVIVLGVSLLCHSSFAETIRLKSGEIYEGKVIDRNENFVTLETGGAPMYLPADQILTGSAEESTEVRTPAPEIPATYEELCLEAKQAMEKKDFPLAEQKSLQAIRLGPKGKEAYYYLYSAQYAQGRYEEAFMNYTKAIELGYPVSQEEQVIMAGYRYKEFTVNLPGRPNLFVKGSTACSLKLILDVISAFSKSMGKAEDLLEIRPKFIKWENEFSNWMEQWVVLTTSGESVLNITFTVSPQGGTDFEIVL